MRRFRDAGWRGVRLSLQNARFRALQDGCPLARPKALSRGGWWAARLKTKSGRFRGLGEPVSAGGPETARFAAQLVRLPAIKPKTPALLPTPKQRPPVVPKSEGATADSSSPSECPCVVGRRYARASIGTYSRSMGPSYHSSGRMRMLFSNCSSTCSVQPGMRPRAKIGMKRSSGMSIR